MADKRVTNEDVKSAITEVQERLTKVGVDTSGWRLLNAPGEGFIILNVSGGFPAETGNRQDTIALCRTWVSVLDLFITKLIGQNVPTSAPESVTDAPESVKAAPVKAGAKKVAATV